MIKEFYDQMIFESQGKELKIFLRKSRDKTIIVYELIQIREMFLKNGMKTEVDEINNILQSCCSDQDRIKLKLQSCLGSFQKAIKFCNSGKFKQAPQKFCCRSSNQYKSLDQLQKIILKKILDKLEEKTQTKTQQFNLKQCKCDLSIINHLKDQPFDKYSWTRHLSINYPDKLTGCIEINLNGICKLNIQSAKLTIKQLKDFLLILPWDRNSLIHIQQGQLKGIRQAFSQDEIRILKHPKINSILLSRKT